MLKHPKKSAKKKKRATGRVKKEKVYRKIDSEVLKEFASNNVTEDVLKKLLKIDNINVFENYFRINIWTLHTQEDRVVPTINLSESFFVELTDNGEIIDLTIRKD
tara:strand:+ start:294 stop:608 length:315 start_codon:yes stop_codon:yes gene_type:complete